MGVLRWQSLIDIAIAESSSLALGKIDHEVLVALRLAVFQLAWLSRVPTSAAINESVELVKQARKRSASAFANAVLRRISRLRDDLKPTLPIRTRDPRTLAALSAHPLWLVERWVSRYGPDVAGKICNYDQSIPVTNVRLRDASAEDALDSEGVSLAPGEFIANARRIVAGNITQTKAFEHKRVVIQDEASQLVAAIVGSGSRFLDCCAAPGGKAWSIADRNPSAEIIAVELHAHRARLLKERVVAQNVHIIHGDVSKLTFEAPFDRVLVDAPCSGTGTLARNPEIKWRLREHDLADLPQRQVSILKSAREQVALGGTIVYSTCSLENEEGEDVIQKVFREDTRFRTVNLDDQLCQLTNSGELILKDTRLLVSGPFLRTIPGIHQSDGFFVAAFQRIA
jgi:16S rRNA (cytosine967-C5)-methyltransferase